MRVLVTWGSKLGGTEGIGRILGEALAAEGFDVTSAPAAEVRRVDGFDAAIVGGALYANRWSPHARRFVQRNVKALRKIPVWFFSSGPLDDTADHDDIAPTTTVAVLAERVGAKGHTTFGGRLAPDAQGFPASAMAKEHSGDWRNPERIRAWARRLAQELPHATPNASREPPARSVGRLLAHAVLGWALCAVTMLVLLPLTSVTVALVVHAIAAPLVFVVIARRYFLAHGAREPLPTALAFTAIVGLLDLVVIGGGVEQSLAMFTSIPGTWLPLALIFLATWATGGIVSTMPWPEKEAPKAHAPPSGGRPLHH